jgi:hypothetical protein
MSERVVMVEMIAYLDSGKAIRHSSGVDADEHSFLAIGRVADALRGDLLERGLDA